MQSVNKEKVSEVKKKMDQYRHKSPIQKVLINYNQCLQALFKILIKCIHITQKFKELWIGLFIVVCILGLVLIDKIYYFRTYDQFKNIRKGSLQSLIQYGLLFTFIYLIYEFGMHWLLDNVATNDWLRRDKYTDNQERNNKGKILVKYFIGTLYYLLFTIFELQVILPTSAFPYWLGGEGYGRKLYENYPYMIDFSFGMELLYYMSLGKHMGRFFIHSFIKAEGDYYSFIFHHLLSCMLICFSYMMNLWLVGIFILFIHDCSDLFYSFTRFYIELQCRKEIVSMILYASTFVFWVGLRNIIFPYYTILSIPEVMIEKYAEFDSLQKQIFIIPCCFMGFMLICLEMLHIVWTSQLIQYLKLKISIKDKQQ